MGMHRRFCLFFSLLVVLASLVVFPAEQAVFAQSQTFSYEQIFKTPYAEYLIDVARDTWRGITHFSVNQTGMPLDRSDPGSQYTSLNNIGLYMACIVGAYDLGFINRTEAINMVNKTLSSVSKLEVWNGFPREWLNAYTLRWIWPDRVSTVSIGWYAAGLITVRNAFPEVKDKCDALLNPMNWNRLYHAQTGLMYGYYDIDVGLYGPFDYTDLSSENRMASFIAIGTEQVPASHWQHLSRAMETREGIQFLSKWDYGLFVYFMPGIFIDERGSFIGRSAANVTRAQMLLAIRKNYNYSAWGFSFCDIPGGGYSFLDYIVTPYASINAIYYYPSEVIKNMKALEMMGVRPESYGFRDSINILTGKVDDSYLVLDQGMIFLSLSNYLNGTIWRYFNADPIAKRAKQLIADYQISNTAKQAYTTIFENATKAVLFAEQEGLDVTVYLSDLMNAKMAYNAGNYAEAVSIAENIMQKTPIYSSNTIWNAILAVQEIAEQGFNVTLAETKLEEARASFHNGYYVSAIESATEAVILAQKSKDSSISINAAEDAIQQAETEGKTENLDRAKQKLQGAKAQYNLGFYDEAQSLAEQAKLLADQARVPESLLPTIITAMGITVAAVCIIGVACYFAKRKGKK